MSAFFLRGYSGGKFFELVSCLGIRLGESFNFRIGVEDGGMVSAAEVSANFLEAVFCEVSGKVHTYLSGQGDALASFFALQVGQSDIKVIGYNINNLGDSNAFFRHKVIGSEGLLCQFKGDLGADGFCGCVDDCQGSFEFPDVGIYFLRDVAGNFLGDTEAAEVGFFLHDGDSCFVAGRIDSCDESPFEPADESFFK